MDREEAASQLARLLEEERAAALAADLPRLEALQDPKQRAVDALSGAPVVAVEALASRARENVTLIRQLVELHRSLLLEHGLESTAYRPTGLIPRVR
jgi:hypothetical protein